jgi:hypothetical protein
MVAEASDPHRVELDVARGQELGDGPADDSVRWAWPLAFAERACCCPARPLVVAVMPPSPGRPYPMDLLLCGHHYRASLVTLAGRPETSEVGHEIVHEIVHEVRHVQGVVAVRGRLSYPVREAR